MSNQDSQLQNYYCHVVPARAGTQKSLHLPDSLLQGNVNPRVLQLAQDVIVFRPNARGNLLLSAFLFCSVLVMLCAGCATVGQDFPDYRVTDKPDHAERDTLDVRFSLESRHRRR